MKQIAVIEEMIFAREADSIKRHIANGEREFGSAAEELISVRDRLRHGQWLPWLKANGFEPRTAQRLIDEYHYPEKADDRRAKNAERERENRKSDTCDAFEDNVIDLPVMPQKWDGPEEDEAPIQGDDDQTIFARGLLARADSAVVGASYEKAWSKFAITQEHVAAADRAAKAWAELAGFLRRNIT